MARKAKKHASGGAEVAATKSDSLPSFDEQALTALTSKIEQQFGKGKPPKEQQPTTGKRSSNYESPGTEAKGRGTKGKARTQEKHARGIKRDAHGNAKAADEPAAKRQKKQAKHQNGEERDGRAVLLEEILALGGTEEDLDLVADVVSDDEEEGSAPTNSTDKSLRKDLANFVAGLGIKGDAQETDADTVTDEEADNAWEEASASESPSVESEEEEAAPPLNKKTEISPSKPEILATSNPNRLVSTIPS